MIKIDKYSNKFEEEYFEIIYTKICKRMAKINKGTCSEKVKKGIECINEDKVNIYFEYIKNSIKNIVFGNIENTKKEFQKILEEISENENSLNTIIEYIFDYENYISRNKSLSYKMAEELNVRVCPYCNKNYVEKVEDNNELKHKYAFDHYYSKSQYPYLAVSLYNLIPICSDCNSIKSSIVFDLNNNIYPFEEGIENEKTFSYDILTTDKYIIKNISKNTKFNNNEKILYIVNRYNESEPDYVKNIIKKYNEVNSIFYNHSIVKKLKINREEIKLLLDYPNKEIKDIQLGKLRKDIIDEVIK